MYLARIKSYWHERIAVNERIAGLSKDAKITCSDNIVIMACVNRRIGAHLNQ